MILACLRRLLKKVLRYQTVLNLHMKVQRKWHWVTWVAATTLNCERAKIVTCLTSSLLFYSTLSTTPFCWHQRKLNTRCMAGACLKLDPHVFAAFFSCGTKSRTLAFSHFRRRELQINEEGHWRKQNLLQPSEIKYGLRNMPAWLTRAWNVTLTARYHMTLISLCLWHLSRFETFAGCMIFYPSPQKYGHCFEFTTPIVFTIKSGKRLMTRFA